MKIIKFRDIADIIKGKIFKDMKQLKVEEKKMIS